MSGIQTSITDVCVYSEGARVSRHATVKVDGKSYSITGLPCRLKDDSLQFETSQGAYIQNSSIELFASKESDESKELNSLNRELEFLQSQESSLKEQLNELEKLSPGSLNKSKADFEKVADAMDQLSDFKRNEYKNLSSQMLPIQKEMQLLKTKIKEIIKNRNDEVSCTKTVNFELITDLDEVEVKIHYLIPDATWSPTYSVNVNNEYSSGTLQMKAMISQNSGEDWKGVNIKLSTSKPYSFRQLPELKSLFIGRKQKDSARSQWRPAPADTESLFHDFDRFVGNKIKTKPLKRPAKKAVDCSARLIILSEIMRGSCFDIDESPLFIGSSEENDIVIPDSTLSGKHARIQVHHGNVFIYDLESTNGTRINGELIFGKTKVNSSDIIQVGGIEILMDDESCTDYISNTTQTNICLDLEDFDNIAPVASGPAAGGLSRTNRSGGVRAKKSLKMKSMSSVSPVKLSQASYSDIPEKRITYEDVLSEGINRHSSLFMETQRLGSRGILAWKSTLEVYKLQLQQIGFTDNADLVLNKLKETKLQLNKLPYEIESNNDFDYCYGGRYKVNIPSSKHHYIVPLQEAECEFRLAYLCIPRESKAFYRSIDLKNPFDTPLLKGPLDIYLEKTFVNTGELNEAPKGGFINLILGEEQNIKLVRNTYFKEETHGLMNGKNLLKHRIVNEVTNSTGKEIKVELRERLPYAHKKHEKHVDVTLTEASPEWHPLPKKKNSGKDEKIHFWTETIESGVSKNFEFKYEIEVSSKEEISGGNRREF